MHPNGLDRAEIAMLEVFLAPILGCSTLKGDSTYQVQRNTLIMTSIFCGALRDLSAAPVSEIHNGNGGCIILLESLDRKRNSFAFCRASLLKKFLMELSLIRMKVVWRLVSLVARKVSITFEGLTFLNTAKQQIRVANQVESAISSHSNSQTNLFPRVPIQL